MLKLCCNWGGSGEAVALSQGSGSVGILSTAFQNQIRKHCELVDISQHWSLNASPCSFSIEQCRVSTITEHPCKPGLMPFNFPRSFWLPFDFYISVSRTSRRISHVPIKVVDAWQEPVSANYKALFLEVQFIIHLTVIVDLKKQLTAGPTQNDQPNRSAAQWPQAIPHDLASDQSKPD